MKSVNLAKSHQTNLSKASLKYLLHKGFME